MSEDHVIDAAETPMTWGTLASRIILQDDGRSLDQPDAFEHILGPFCWCFPIVEEDLLGGRLFIHRRTLDSPHIESRGA